MPRRLCLAVFALCPMALVACTAPIDESSGRLGVFSTGCTTTTVATLSPHLGFGFGGQCLAEEPIVEADGTSVDCTVIDARHTAPGACTCPAEAGRMPVSAAHAAVAASVRGSTAEVAEDLNCLCEVRQLHGPDAETCRDHGNGDGDGFCFFDFLHPPPGTVISGSGGLCPPNDPRIVFYAGGAQLPPAPNVGYTRTVVCAVDCR